MLTPPKSTSLALIFAAILPAGLVPAASAQAAAANARPIVIDDSAFWGRMPLKDQVGNAASQNVPWLFNNTALLLLQQANVEAEVDVPVAGTYHLFARSKSDAGNSFRVAFGTALSPSITGDGTFAWRRAGEFKLAAGRQIVRLTRIDTAPVLDALVLTPDPNFSEEAIKPLQLAPEVKLIKEYRVPPPLSLNFGHADNDGRLDLVVMAPGYSAHVFDHDGKELWRYQAPTAGAAPRSTDDINALIWDLEGDGRSEVLHWRFLDNREMLVVADARTGEIKQQTPWPTAPLPHAYNNFRIAIAKFAPGRAAHILVYSDSGGAIILQAYNSALEPVWRHTEPKKKDHLGHYPYLKDITGDGLEEVIVSSLVLDHTGKPLWNRFDLFDDHHDHADMFRFADLDGDRREEMIAPVSDVGLVAFDPRDGRVLWWRQAEHAQRLAVGNFLAQGRAPHLAVGARFYGNRQFEPALYSQVHWFDAAGTPVGKWPEHPLNCNPVFVQGDWRGNGGQELFWHLFHLNREGRGTLFFSEPVYHAFDFSGDRAEEVVTLENDMLRIYGHRDADHRQQKNGRDEEYLRLRTANHDH